MPEDSTALLFQLLRELTDKVSLLSVQIARIETRVQTFKECPSPGTCLALVPRIEAIEKREAAKDGERKGLTLAGKAVWAFIGSGGLAVLLGLYSYLKP